MQVPHVGVEQPRLPRDRIGDAWMRVPDNGHVVVAVEESLTVGIEQPHAFPAHQVQRTAIRERRQRRTEHLAATRDQRRIIDRASLRAQPCAEQIEPFGLEEAQERPQPVLPPTQVGVVGMAIRPPAEQYRDGDEPRREQIRQHRELLGLQRGDRSVPVDDPHRQRHHRGGLAPRQQRLEGGGDVTHERRVAHVAEIDDAADAATIVDERVVQRHISVDHLRAQRRPPRQHLGLEAIEDAVHERTMRRVIDRVGQ